MRISDRTQTRLLVGAVAGLITMLVFVAVAFPLVRVRMDDPVAECALKYEERKTQLVDARWSWLPPGWKCRFTNGPSGRVP